MRSTTLGTTAMRLLVHYCGPRGPALQVRQEARNGSPYDPTSITIDKLLLYVHVHVLLLDLEHAPHRTHECLACCQRCSVVAFTWRAVSVHLFHIWSASGPAISRSQRAPCALFVRAQLAWHWLRARARIPAHAEGRRVGKLKWWLRRRVTGCGCSNKAGLRM